MPELPDVVVYLEALEARISGHTLNDLRLANPFLLRSVDPPPEAFVGKQVTGFRRLGKRLVWEFPDHYYLVLHLMIAGRLRWTPPGAAIPRKLGLASFDFTPGSVLLTEAGSKRRASLHLVRGEEGLRAFSRGGLEVLDADAAAFLATLRRENHTLKRTLTDPRLFSGIGNAYSDEILHRAGFSPFQMSPRLSDAEGLRLYQATQEVLREWTEALRAQAGGDFPSRVTAFRKGMAVHGRYNQPCPVCGAPIQRIVYAENECNYCAGCQTDGRVLKDRSLSRLLKGDWPRTLAELEERKPGTAD